jgi:hypothetical protein
LVPEEAEGGNDGQEKGLEGIKEQGSYCNQYSQLEISRVRPLMPFLISQSEAHKVI